MWGWGGESAVGSSAPGKTLLQSSPPWKAVLAEWLRGTCDAEINLPFLFSFGSIWALLSARIYVGFLPRRELQAAEKGCVIICHLSQCLCDTVTVSVAVCLSLCPSLSISSPFYLLGCCGAVHRIFVSQQSNGNSIDTLLPPPPPHKGTFFFPGMSTQTF